MKKLLAGATTGFSFDHDALADKRQPYTFISNHRDIVLDAALLDIALIEAQFPNTVQIAIGDNLFAYPWIEKLARLNKSFVVRRGIGLRETLLASKKLSAYMHHCIEVQKHSIWIAQREGRAKDGNDRTQEAVLKMIAMSSEATPLESLKAMHIVPLAISYEYDPCDYLKAKEFQQRRDNPAFKKTREDDVLSMRTGIFGYKGQVHYAAAPCINEWIDELSELPTKEFFTAVAQHIDTAIFTHFKAFAVNHIAADLLQGSEARTEHYTTEEKNHFIAYLHSRIDKIEVENKDEAFLFSKLIEMYANPLLNKEGVERC